MIASGDALSSLKTTKIEMGNELKEPNQSFNPLFASSAILSLSDDITLQFNDVLILLSFLWCYQ